MSLLLRKIRRSRWYKQPWSWLKESEAPADPLGDLETLDNRLSVWHIEHGEGNLRQVVTAIATTRDKPAHLDYALFTPDLLTEISIDIENTVGKTLNRRVNMSWHRELVNLSAINVAKLAYLMMKRGTTHRYSEKEVISFIQEAVNSGQIDRDKIPDNIKSRLSD